MFPRVPHSLLYYYISPIDTLVGSASVPIRAPKQGRRPPSSSSSSSSSWRANRGIILSSPSLWRASGPLCSSFCFHFFFQRRSRAREVYRRIRYSRLFCEMRADMRQMRSARRGGGAKSGWDVLPNPNTRNLARGNERRHDAKSRGQNPRRSPISERARFDDFSLSADAAVSRRHKRREDRSPPVPLSPQFWGGGEAVSFDRNTHDGLYREYQRPDHPLAARIEDRLIELGDFQHRRFIEDGPLIDPSGALVDDRGRLAQRSVYLDDDSSRWKFLPLPSDRPVRLEDPSEMNPVDNMVSITTGDATRIGVPGPHELRYHEYSKVAAYDEGRGARIYHMEDSPHVIDFSSQRRRLIAASSSSAPVEDVYAVSFRDEIHQKPAVGALGRGSGLRRFRDETLDRDAYNWTDTVDAQAMAHPVAYKVRDQSFSEEDWKRRVISAEEDLPWNSELDRTFKKARWGSPTRRDLEGALEEQRYVEEGAISDYQEMEYFASRGKPSHRDEVLHLGRNSRYIREDLEQMNIPRETRNARAIEMDNEDERWTDQERMEREFVPARRPGRFDHSRLGRLGRKVSGSDVRRRLQDSGRESQQGMRNFAERSLQKIDPPKDSQEFKLQTHKAFLRFSKILNEDSTQRDKYRQEGKAYQGFICYVCGRSVFHYFLSIKI